MKYLIILFISPVILAAFKRGSGGACSYNTSNVPAIDSLYNAIISSGGDSVLLYHAVKSDIQTNGIISWKTSGQLSLIIFETQLGKIKTERTELRSETILREARAMYFANETSIADTIPALQVKTANEYVISIESRAGTHSRAHSLSSYPVTISHPSTYMLVNVAKKFNQILLTER